MININLLPPEARKNNPGRRSTAVPAWLIPAGMASVVALAATTLTLRQLQEIRSLEDEMATLTREKQKYKQQVALLDEIQFRRDDLTRRVEAARDLDHGRGAYVKELMALNSVLPSSLWLTAVTEESVGQQVRIEGRSMSPLSVFVLMHGLEVSEPFEDVTLEYLKKDPDQEMGATSFVLMSRTL